MASFQFYEEIFMCCNLIDDLIVALFDSLSRLTDFLIAHENANSPLLGALGRLIRTVLPATKPRMTADILNRWIVIIEKTIFDVNCGDFLPPTSHKAMDALCLVLPLDIALTKQIYTCLVKIACNSMHNQRLTEVALDHITELCKKVPTEFIPQLFVMSGQLFSLPCARKLLLDFVEKDVPIADESVEEVARTLMELGRSNAELKEKTGAVVVRLFPRVSKEGRQCFFECYKDSFAVASDLLKRYCDPRGSDFSDEISGECCEGGIECIARQLPKCSDDDVLMLRLKFVGNLRTKIGNEKDTYHLFLLLPVLADLVLHPSPVVRKKLRKILLVLGERN
jgi:hypothetical protein